MAAAQVRGPFTFEAAAPDGRWLVTCQARADSDGDGRLHVGLTAGGELNGDALVRYLSFASGEEQEIDAFLASSADGRWLSIEKDGKVELLDTANGARVDLSAAGVDARREPMRRGAHRALAFDGESLFYLRRGRQTTELLERRLLSGVERLLYHGPELALRVELDAAGATLLLTVAGIDANGNGRFDGPYQLEQGKRSCRGPVARYLSPRLDADPFGFIVVDRNTGQARRLDDLAAVFGHEAIRRAADGALVAERGQQRRLLADSACSGRILWLDPARDQLLVGCTLPKKAGRLAVELVARGRHTPLEIDVAALAFDEVARPAERLVTLYPGADTVLFDADKQLLHRLKSGDAVLATAGAHALVRRARGLLVFDADAGTETPLPGKLDALGDVLRSGSLVFASPFVIDVAEGRVLGSIEGRPLALSNSGAGLVPASAATSESLGEGPVYWQTPG
jgi:hypothetical protein